MGRRTWIIGTAIFALWLGAYLFLVLPRARVEQRVVSVGVFLILIGLVYGGATELLSRPKPLRLEWRDAGKAEVVSAMPIEDEAIYLWLSMPDEREPRAYVLPWSRDAIGRASCRERVGQYVWISVVAAELEKKKTLNT